MPLMPLRNHRLSWDQRKVLHERLQQRASLLRADLSHALHPPGSPTLGLAAPRETSDDDAVGDLQSTLEVAGVQRDAEELREIDAALGRLETGAFGACIDCGAPIAWDRLLARPQVQRCTRCQAGAERGRTTAASL
jgi:DnaK suppressor protein